MYKNVFIDFSLCPYLAKRCDAVDFTGGWCTSCCMTIDIPGVRDQSKLHDDRTPSLSYALLRLRVLGLFPAFIDEGKA